MKLPCYRILSAPNATRAANIFFRVRVGTLPYYIVYSAIGQRKQEIKGPCDKNSRINQKVCAPACTTVNVFIGLGGFDRMN